MASGVFVHKSDLEKVRDTLAMNERHHVARDEMNAASHLGPVRHSPITSETIAARERIDAFLDEADARGTTP